MNAFGKAIWLVETPTFQGIFRSTTRKRSAACLAKPRVTAFGFATGAFVWALTCAALA